MNSRRVAAVAGAALVGSALVPLGSGSAHAATGFRSISTVHHAKIQACKFSGIGGWKVRARLDNRGSRHTHRGSVTKSDNGKGVSFRTPAGRMSKVKTLPGFFRGSQFISGGIFEIGPGGAGSGAPVSWLHVC